MTNRDPARLPRCSWRLAAALIFAAASAPAPAAAQREPVLSQIKLPHSYYYREMYLPQLTSGPSSVAWSPDGTELVYAMQGSLWRQRIDSTAAQQLTAGPGYDYQPDWSPDGRWIAFSRYDGAALELFALEVTSGALHPLTNAGAVNVEPRWSPDGSKLAFVSTSTCGHFHIFVAAVSDGRIERAVQLTPERRSAVPRYYYSQVDHEISPSWSADGEEILFVSNRDRIYGSGALWRMAAQPGAEPRLVHDEETTWKARPDWARDGSDRVVYSSYLGRQWHQLWVLPAAGGLPIPLSYGEFDRTAARWAPDGRKIAYISNQEGNTSLWILELPGGNQRRLVARERRTLRPTARLRVTVLDQRGQPTAARVAVHDGGGRFHAPDDTWIHADDAFVRSERKFEAHYFHSSGSSELIVPAGRVTVEAMKGFERRPASTAMELEAGEERSVELRLARLDLPADWERWVGGDLHVHMNYGGTYRNDPERMVAQAEAEDLRVIHNLIVNKEQRIPDIAYFSTQPDPASNARTLLLHGQEFHTSYWGHLGLLGLQRNLLLPDYAAYPGTAVASLFPTNAAVADLAHEQGALVGYVHPFDFAPDPADRGARLTYALPADVALGKVDYYEAVGFSDHLITAAVWYRLLNCGFKLPAGGGTDAMANYASLRGPVGMNRVYVLLDGPLAAAEWNESLRRGRSMATNGPLLRLRLDGREAGGELALPEGGATVEFEAMLRSIVPIDHLQLVVNGAVAQELELSGDPTRADVRGTLAVERSGWVVLRAWSERPIDPVLDLYPYATTSPIYFKVGDEEVRSPADARFFLAWLDRAIESAESGSYFTAREKDETLETLRRARAVYESRR